MVDALGIEGGGSTLDAMYLVALGEKKLGKVGAVLSGYAGDECFFHVDPLAESLCRASLCKHLSGPINNG